MSALALGTQMREIPLHEADRVGAVSVCTSQSPTVRVVLSKQEIINAMLRGENP